MAGVAVSGEMQKGRPGGGDPGSPVSPPGKPG